MWNMFMKKYYVVIKRSELGVYKIIWINFKCFKRKEIEVYSIVLYNI